MVIRLQIKCFNSSIVPISLHPVQVRGKEEKEIEKKRRVGKAETKRVKVKKVEIKRRSGGEKSVQGQEKEEELYTTCYKIVKYPVT